MKILTHLKGLTTVFLDHKTLVVHTHTNNSRRADRKGGRGVNAYGQPDRKISVFFYDSPNQRDSVMRGRVNNFSGLVFLCSLTSLISYHNLKGDAIITIR